MPVAITPSRLTLSDSAAAMQEGCAAIAAGAVDVDLGGLERFDSAALATLLAWQRAAAERGAALSIQRCPPGLASIARVYGVAHLLES